MFIVTLRFADSPHRAADRMDDHQKWLARGFDDGVFLLAGTLAASAGGAVLAYGTTLDALQARVADDPFVADHVVTAEITELTAGRTDPRLSFLLA